MQAMAGDLATLTKNMSEVAGTGVTAATAVLSVTAPVVPTELVKAAAAAAGSQSGWLHKMGLRLFRPRLFFIVNLAGTADRGQRSFTMRCDSLGLILVLPSGRNASLKQCHERLGSPKWAVASATRHWATPAHLPPSKPVDDVAFAVEDHVDSGDRRAPHPGRSSVARVSHTAA